MDNDNQYIPPEQYYIEYQDTSSSIIIIYIASLILLIVLLYYVYRTETDRVSCKLEGLKEGSYGGVDVYLYNNSEIPGLKEWRNENPGIYQHNNKSWVNHPDVSKKIDLGRWKVDEKYTNDSYKEGNCRHYNNNGEPFIAALKPERDDYYMF